MRLHFIDITSTRANLEHPGIPSWIDLDHVYSISDLTRTMHGDNHVGYMFVVRFLLNPAPMEYATTLQTCDALYRGWEEGMTYTLAPRPQAEIDHFIAQYDVLLEKWSSINK